MSAEKTYCVVITQSKTVTILVKDCSAQSAMTKAEIYALTHQEVFSVKPREITRRRVTLLRDEIVTADVDMTK